MVLSLFGVIKEQDCASAAANAYLNAFKEGMSCHCAEAILANGNSHAEVSFVPQSTRSAQHGDQECLAACVRAASVAECDLAVR
jgi:hypothetical protein